MCGSGGMCDIEQIRRYGRVVGTASTLGHSLQVGDRVEIQWVAPVATRLTTPLRDLACANPEAGKGWPYLQ